MRKHLITGILIGLVAGFSLTAFASYNPSVPTVLSGTSGAIAPGALIAGTCGTGTVTVTGAATGDVAAVIASTYPGDGAYYFARVTSANTVTVYVCGAIALTPASSTYVVKVIK